MQKKISFILIFVFIFCIVVCSRSISNTINKKDPVELPLVAKTSSTHDIDPFGKSVPVLEYHSITTNKSDPICISIKKFTEQMRYLKDNGYSTITLRNLYGYLMNNTPIPKKSVVLTFDDGYENNYSAMFPILKEYNLKATIFVITGKVDKNRNFLKSKQLIYMEENGVDIESHTINHDNLKKVSKVKQLKTLIQSKKYLEKTLNKQIKYFAYPYGGYNQNAIEALKETGYKMAFTTESGWASKSNGILSLHRVWVDPNDSLKAFHNKISNPNYLYELSNYL